MNSLIEELFKTNAIRISGEANPFWYTSGKIGPYFINTQFLFGNEEKANELLKYIDENLGNKPELMKNVSKRVIDFYKTNSSFKNAMDDFYSSIKTNPKFIQSKFISGGERRDWFFSPVISHLCGKESLFIFKNLEVYSMEKQITDLKGEAVCHIADLINEASSYERGWIPAIKNINAKLSFTASVVDRCQGGGDFLKSKNIETVSPVKIEPAFFEKAFKLKVINEKQLKQLIDYMKNPHDFGKNFIENNPDFIKKSYNCGEKSTKSKVDIFFKDNPYGFDLKKYENLIK